MHLLIHKATGLILWGFPSSAPGVELVEVASVPSDVAPQTHRLVAGDFVADGFRVDLFREEGRAEVRELARRLIPVESLTPEQAQEALSIYPAYAVGITYRAGEAVVYDGHLYVVAQTHTSQADWPPHQTPALYVRKTPAGTYAAWVQPQGAHDAYALDALVSHNGQVWRSTVAANVWEPGVYGWVVDAQL